MDVDPVSTAVVITDPQNDFLSPDGVTWGVVGASVEEHGTVENLSRLFEAAKSADMTVAISPTTTTPPTRAGASRGRWRS